MIVSDVPLAYTSALSKKFTPASHAAAKEFDLAIGLQEKIVERAPSPQKPLAQKLLELYRNEKPFDPDLKIENESEKANATDNFKSASDSSGKR